MSLMRSLDSGVSGLTNHQAILDTTGNNLANVSTSGFKAGHISFATAIGQTISAGSAPGSTTGGTNPRQVGLGVTTSSIDIDTRQGALQATGRSLDLAIQGEGLFKVTNTNPQEGTYYTRVGNFGFDKNDDLVDLSSGLRVNGIQAAVQGAISLTQYRSINATATSTISFQGNLNANNATFRGTEVQSVLPLIEASSDGTSFTPATETTLLKDLTLFNGDSTDMGVLMSGSGTASGGASPSDLLAATTITTGGRLHIEVTVPAIDYTVSGGTQLQIKRAGVTIGSVDVTGDLSAASAAARVFSLDSTSIISADDVISLVATDVTTGLADGDAGTYTYTSSMLTDLSIFGTKPDGEVYGGKIAIDPWKETAGDLIAKVNSVLTHGTRRFGTASLDSGNLTVRALESGSGFSLFVGEDDLLPLGSTEPASLVSGIGAAAAHPGAGTTTLASNIAAGAPGALRPSFTLPAADLSGQLGASMLITVKVNGASAGTVTVPAANYTVANPVFTLQSFPQVLSTDLVTYELSGNLVTGVVTPATVIGKLTESGAGGTGFNYRGDSTLGVAASTLTSGGLLVPTIIMPPVDLSGQTGRTLKVSIKINGSERGSISIPPADYSGGADNEFDMPNMPHVKSGDIITFDVSGTMDFGAGNNMTWSTSMVADSDTASILQDRDSTGAPDGQPDMFEDDPTDPTTTDLNRWQYSLDNNTNFNWYRARFSPDVVSTTIDVYDSNGSKHSVEARYFKSGTKTDAISGAKTNVWDMIANINPAEGTIAGDLVTGIQFDSEGKYVGDASLGATARGLGLDSNGYKGQPDNSSLEVVWNNSGPGTIQMDYGETNGTDGLTGFGTSSTAAAINQDGFANGSLTSISVQANGDIKGLYSNGQGQTIASIQLFTFRNTAGLIAAGGNLWQPSSNSGQETPRTPGEGGAGSLTAGSLEGSNVDIASEFTRLITAQRGFQVNARVIQTSDSLLQELAGLIR
ncbi:MAG: flagellar hook-basal body complex protein [Planctomycetota bacterium]